MVRRFKPQECISTRHFACHGQAPSTRHLVRRWCQLHVVDLKLQRCALRGNPSKDGETSKVLDHDHERTES